MKMKRNQKSEKGNNLQNRKVTPLQKRSTISCFELVRVCCWCTKGDKVIYDLKKNVVSEHTKEVWRRKREREREDREREKIEKERAHLTSSESGGDVSVK